MMKYHSLTLLFMLMAMSSALPAIDFYSFTSGPWGDQVTWWGGIEGPLPGPGDNVFIRPGTAVSGSGSCNNLTIMGQAGNMGMLHGDFGGSSACMVYGDLVCDGYLLSGGGGGIFTLEVWGNVSVTGALMPSSLNLTGGSASVLDQATVFQEPGAIFHTQITAGPSFPGLRLLSDLNLDAQDGYHTPGTVTGLEIYPFQYSVSRSRLINCSFTALPGCFEGHLVDCQLSAFESFVALETSGDTVLLNNQCVFHDHIHISGNLYGPVSMSGSFVCSDITINGSVSAGWNGTLNIFCNGSLFNNGSLQSDVCFTAGNTHFWFMADGAVIIGDICNLGNALYLQSDLIMATQGEMAVGDLFQQGYILANLKLRDGTIHTGGGTITACELASVTLDGDVVLNGGNVIGDNAVIFSTSTTNLGILECGAAASCQTHFMGPLINEGVLTSGWSGALIIYCHSDLSSSGAITADQLIFTGPAIHEFDWAPGSFFNCDVVNQSPLLRLVGTDPLAGSARTWNLASCEVVGPVSLNDLTLMSSTLIGTHLLSLNNVSLDAVNLDLPVRVLGDGATLIGSQNVFWHDLTLAGILGGTSFALQEFLCCEDLILSGGTLGNGYSGQMTVRLKGDLVVDDGYMDAWMIVFEGTGVQQVTQVGTGSFATTIRIEDGSSPVLASDLNLNYFTRILLNSQELDLGSHQLQYARLEGGSVRSGSLRDCHIMSAQLTDIDLFGETWLLDNGCQAWGFLNNQGTFRGTDWQHNTFEIMGSVTNGGSFIPGYTGVLSLICHGDIANSGIWQAATLLRGSQPRSLILNNPGFDISVEQGACFNLLGNSQLSCFEVGPGACVTVSPGASLSFPGPDEFYVANQPGYGMFLNRGTVTNQRSLNDLSPLIYQALQIMPTGPMAADYEGIQTTHGYNILPPDLANAYVDLWSVQPLGYSQLRSGGMRFFHSPETRIYQEDLVLWHKALGSGLWCVYDGAFSYDTSDCSYTALDVTVGGDYAFVAGNMASPENLSVSLQNGCPHLVWDILQNAIRYRVFSSQDPDGPWNMRAMTQETQWVDPELTRQRFYKVRAEMSDR